MTLRARSYLNGCVLPTIGIIHQLDDKRPAGDDSCSTRKEVSVAEEEAFWRRIHTHAHAHRDAQLPCIVRQTCIFGPEHVHIREAEQRCLLKVSRAQRPRVSRGFFLPKSAAKNITLKTVTSLTNKKWL